MPIKRAIAASALGWVALADAVSVFLNVEAIAPAQPTFTASAFAFIDPYFFIDPDFLAQHPGYSLSTPNVGNVQVIAVPEPSTWALFGSCLVALQAWSRRRRAHASDVVRSSCPAVAA